MNNEENDTIDAPQEEQPEDSEAQLRDTPLPSQSCSSSTTTTTEGPNDEGDALGFNLNSYHCHLEDQLPLETNTDQDCPFYNLEHGRKLAIIFNHAIFKHDRVGAREGTEHDVTAIKETFDGLGFEVHHHDDLTVDRIFQVLYNIQKEKDLSCLALFILSHGEADGLLYAYDQNYKLHRNVIQELLPDVCPSLAGKPKMIFIQACQGMNTDPGVVLAARGRQRHTSSDSAKNVALPYCIPNYSDLLIYSAAYTGHYSFRNKREGSWLIQILCKELQESPDTEDLVSVLTRVSHKVAISKSSRSYDERLNSKKQIPLKQDTLIRKIYLKSTPMYPLIRNEVPTLQNNTNGTSKTTTTDQKLKSKDTCLCM